MNLILSDKQVALNALYVAIRKSADHSRDLARFIDDAKLTTALGEIAVQREILSQNVRAVIHTLGDLPAEPDPDRETLEQLAHKIRALVSSDQQVKILEQCLGAEQEVARRAADARKLGLDDTCATMIDDVENQVRIVTRRLQTLMDEYTG